MGSFRRASKSLKSSKYLSLLHNSSLFGGNPFIGRLNSHHRVGLSQTFCSNSRQNSTENVIDLNQYPLERGQPQYLDKLQVERERGITVKAQTATMFYNHHSSLGVGSDNKQEEQSFLLNLIDTPGHVDFSYEVSRSLAACQGALLVVDAAQGVQAQTVANFYLAFESNLTIIPVINKIDQPTADPDRFKPVRHMVFSGLYPADGSDFEALNHAIERLTCNDASVSIAKESSTALGLGFRLASHGCFHQRLEQEYGAHVISTIPTVPYIFEYADGSKISVQNPAALPSNPKQRVVASWEPTVLATIIIPSEYVGPIITLCSERRGEQLEYTFIDSLRVFLKYRLPLREIVVDFYNELKSITSGYASFDYEDSEYQQSDLVKLDILLNGQPVDAMASIVHNLKAQRVGREQVEKLRKFIDRQMFEIIIQAAIGSKVVARETISAMRKNVLAKCYGGDVSRKKKLLEKQKEGKKRMKRVGSVDIPQEAFHQLLKPTLLPQSGGCLGSDVGPKLWSDDDLEFDDGAKADVVEEVNCGVVRSRVIVGNKGDKLVEE
uniref:Tr-type G domain-containing protein n=1 Tax=Cannabis sativa TaxID=3483 RepID=A0A803QM68_CANSA